MATQRQTFMYNFHRQQCANLGLLQSTIQHKQMAGTVSGPNAQGNYTYTPPGPGNPTTTSDQVWAITMPMPMRSAEGNDTEIGRQAVQMLRGQCPAIDDSGTVISIAEEDWLTDASGMLFRIVNPVLTPDGSLWSFMLER